MPRLYAPLPHINPEIEGCFALISVSLDALPDFPFHCHLTSIGKMLRVEAHVLQGYAISTQMQEQ